MKTVQGLCRQMAPALLLALACPVLAGEDEVKTILTPLQFQPAEEAEGSQFRPLVDELMQPTDDLLTKRKKLQPLLVFCNEKRDTATVRHASVSTAEQRKRLLAAQPAGRQVKFVDISCPRAYMISAFISIEERDMSGAFGWLEKAEAMAPYMAWPLTERGYISNGLGRREEALAAYRKALAVAEENPPEAYAKPIALRGLGWTLVELGDLLAARKLYEESLVVDPDNKGAKDEIEYIDGRLKKAPSQLVAPAPTEQAPQEDIRRRVIDTTRKLETDPFSDQAKADRSWLLQWITDSPDVGVMICDTMGLVDKDNKRDFTPEILIQSMAGNAVWQLEHPGSGNEEQAMQLAAVRSALKAYAAFMKKFQTQRIASLDTLAEHEAKGDLDAYLAPIVAEKCTGKD